MAGGWAILGGRPFCPLLALLALSACGEFNLGDTAPERLDLDRDGADSDEDCDDLDASVNPYAVEVCDGIDNDCDGETDDEDPEVEDPPWWYPDSDLDGWGVSSAEPALQACTQPTGWVSDEQLEDCDDEDPEVNPGASESCNELDDDCDGEIDEDDAVDAVTWYMDGDGDGYGDDGANVTACLAPDRHAEKSGDCDDGDAAVNPGAEELCNEIDDDCDGETEEDGAADAPSWYADHDADGYGDTQVPWIACQQPKGYAAGDGDCDDGDAAVHPAAEETCNEIDDDCDGETDEEVALAPFFYTDADGDGYGDADSAVQACSPASDQVGNAGDCDDDSSAVNPGATEICNGIDDDCDGVADEDDAADAPSWYADTDGDGFGDANGSAVASCQLPSGHTNDASDCNDGDAAVNPDATELCNQVDDDCDGATDEDDAGDAATWYRDEDGDGFGNGSFPDVACEQPSAHVAGEADGIAFDCDDSDAAVNPDATELCDNVDNDCDGDRDEDDAEDATTWYLDDDGDGYGDDASATTSCSAPVQHISTPGDCDDSHPRINPGAAETCDEADNDCDGQTDEDDAEDAATWYADGDGDGYGLSDSAVQACTQPSGYASADGDCDDADGEVHPAAAETCDGVDQDCDGPTDEDAEDASTYFLDADGDGYGLTSSFTDACEAPSGYAAQGEDCDDGDAATHPAAEETCDGTDNDCDGVTDEDDAADASTWYPDADRDGFGDATSSSAACAAPANHVSDASDCDDGDQRIFPGANETCDGVDNDCDGQTDEDDAIDATTWTLDDDGDGYGDDAQSVTSCEQPTDHSSTGGDCDDEDAAVNPGAIEVCDGTDNDCSGSTDQANSVAFISAASGQAQDLSSSFNAGSFAAPAAYAFSSDGDLNFCQGTYYVAITITATDASIVGPHGGAHTVLQGGMSDRLITADSGAAAIALSGLTMEYAAVSSDGGAFHSAIRGLQLSVDDCSFANNSAGSGGAVLLESGDAQISDSSFLSNAASDDGGALSVTDGSLDVRSCSFQLNEASSGQGGAIYADGSELSLVETSFSRNDSPMGDGGAVYALASELSLQEASFTSNESASGSGGAVFASGSLASVEGALFDSNQAGSAGGAVGLEDGSEWLEEGGSYEENVASLAGGALGARDSIISLTETLVSVNSADGGAGLGGGVFLQATELFCEDSAGAGAGFLQNDAFSGGAVYLSDSASVIQSIDCDWGTEGSSDDNEPDDIHLACTGLSHDFDDDQSFDCSCETCP